MLSTFNRAVLFALILAAPMHGAQRPYVVDATVSVSSGLDNRSTARLLSGSNASRDLDNFYSVLPGLGINSRNSRSSFSGQYVFGFTQRFADTTVESRSHSVRTEFSTDLGQAWKLSVSDSFRMTDDAGSFNALRGVASDALDPDFVFEPVALQLRTRSNSAQARAEVQMTARASLAFSGSHTFRDYERTSRVTGRLSDQQGFNGRAALTWRLSDAEQWHVSYAERYSQFRDFQDSRAHTVELGYSTEFDGGYSIGLSGGISQVESVSDEDDYIGYNASANFSRKFGSNDISASFAQTSGQQSGLGATSDVRRGSLGWTYQVSKSVKVFADTGIFDSKSVLGNMNEFRGYFATGNLAYELSRHLSLQAGTHFQRYDRNSPFAFTHKRIFVSLRYTNDNLWSFAR